MVFSVVKRTPYFLRWNCAWRRGLLFGPPHEFAAVHHVLTSWGFNPANGSRHGMWMRRKYATVSKIFEKDLSHGKCHENLLSFLPNKDFTVLLFELLVK